MSSIRSYGRRVGSLFAVAALTLATITPGLIPSFASAAQLTERSIAVSSATKAATGVSYEVAFTAVGAAGSMIIDFCENSALINAACDTPAGFSATGVSSPTAGFTATSVDANTVRVVGTIATGAVTFELAGITNPTDSGPLYARFVTYNGTNSTNYTDATSLGANTVDDGGAAVLITDNINVSGAVLESLSFCVAGPTPDTDPGNEGQFLPTTIGDGCTGPLPAPTLRLGERVGTAYALSSNVVSEGNLYTQISTNAVSGAVVNLKSNAFGCGGLMRTGPTNCDIAPAQATGISGGQAKFGLKTNTPGVTGDDLINPIGNYNTSTFALNYNATDESDGVTSPYGDPIFNTNGAPISNGNLALTFGASVTPSTPAGLYSANLSLIATGKF